MTSILIFTALFALQIADFWSTLRAISEGKASEANPILDQIIYRIGLVPTLVLAKGAGVALAFYLAYFGHPMFGLALIALYVYVVQNNLRILWSR